MKPKFDAKADYQPTSFEFEDKKAVDEILSRYPDYGKKSAVMPLLDLAQRQVAETGPFGEQETGGGWIPVAAMDKIAEIIGQPPVKVYEVATFYSMYKLAPVGKYNIQVCGTTPCWLCGSKQIIDTCKEEIGIGLHETSEDGMFTLEEVECLGACVNAPMLQINGDQYYEDLTPERMKEVIELLRAGKEDEIPVGSQTGRKCSMSAAGPSTLKAQAKAAGVK